MRDLGAEVTEINSIKRKSTMDNLNEVKKKIDKYDHIILTSVNGVNMFFDYLIKEKIDNMFNNEVEDVFDGTDIYCTDFEDFLDNIELNSDDFMFLDPPYDTDFSNYEGKDFTKKDQERLAEALKKTKAQFILVIKNTEFIYSLYKDIFQILTFDNQYTYNVRSRNNRNVEHLIITNLPI